MSTSFAIQVVVSAALLLAVRSGPAPAGEEAPGKVSPAGAPAGEKVKLLLSFEKEEMEKKGFKVSRWKDTPDKDKQGLTAEVWQDTECLLCAGGWQIPLLVPGHATHGELSLVKPYCRTWGSNATVRTHVFGMSSGCEKQTQKQQVINFGKESRKVLGGDWSGYDNLLLDVSSPEGDVWLRLIVEDVEDSTPYVRYRVPKGKAGTLVFPLAKYADPKRQTYYIEPDKIVNLIIYMEAATSETGNLYLDNLRLATKDAPAPENPLEPTEEIGRDWGWPETAKKLPPITFAKDVKKETGKVSKLGPVKLPLESEQLYDSENSDFERGVVAFDNRRILVLHHATLSQAKGTVLALATYDRGETWNGIAGPGSKPTVLSGGVHIMGFGAEGVSGSAYLTFDVQPRVKDYTAPRLSIPEGDFYDRFADVGYCYGGNTIRPCGVEVLSFKGDRWEAGRFGLVDDTMRHCNFFRGFLRLPPNKEAPDGRLWTFVKMDSHPVGSQFVRANCSDDNGLTWKLGDRRRGVTPMNMNVSYPCGLNYDDQAACVFGRHNERGVLWTRFDGRRWGEAEWISKEDSLRSVASLGPKRPFVFLQGSEDDLYLAGFEAAKGEWTKTLVHKGGAPGFWTKAASGRLLSALLTVSGQDLYCVWARLNLPKKDVAGREVWGSTIFVCRYDGRSGKLGPVSEVATETEPINSLALPDISPPDYVPIFWDNRLYNRYWHYGGSYAGAEFAKLKKDYPLWVKFLRVPNRPEEDPPAN